MKSILLSLLICFSFAISQAQSIKKEPTAPAYFHVTLTDDVALVLGFDTFTQIALSLQKKNKKVIEIMDASYGMVEKKFSNLNGFKILPANTLEGKINYTKIGYPRTSLKKAAAAVDNQELVKIQINGFIPKKLNTSFRIGNDDKTLVKKKSKQIPEVEIVMTFCDAKGNKTLKVTGSSLTPDVEPIYVTTRSLQTDKFRISSLKPNVESIPFYYYLEIAIDDLIKKLDI